MLPDIKTDYSIIIPAYNEEEYLPATLASVKTAMASIPYVKGEIIVTDNNSTDSTSSVAEEFGARVIFEEHRQIAKSRNTGAKNARGKYFIFIDSDTILSPALLEKTLNALMSGKYCGGGAVAVFDGKLPLAAAFLPKLWLFLSKSFKWACGAYLFCSRDAFTGTGGFDEHYYASEEIHFSRALRLWGRKHGRLFVILKEPVLTSSRKFKWYSTWDHLMIFKEMFSHKKPFMSRKACYRMWYRHPEKKD